MVTGFVVAPGAVADDGKTAVIPQDATHTLRGKIDMVDYTETNGNHTKSSYYQPRECTIKYTTPPKYAEPLPKPDQNWISVQCPPGQGYKKVDVSYKWSYDPQTKGVVSETKTDTFPADGKPHTLKVRFSPMHPAPTGSLGLNTKLGVTPVF
ncbi:hypothetical protein [Psychromicrobium lacuslunae]|uniref:hypothetical protein n=1 Tax=Psychromicrobium lacuslunae TaxID=1618207 RepID=UPI0012FF2011|nr:hypothetical protein [Psychromicrobium lacuslunae]